LQDDGGQSPPVIGLAAQAGPAVAEKAVLFGHRVIWAALDHGDPGIAQPTGGVGGQTEQEMTGVKYLRLHSSILLRDWIKTI